MPLEKGPAPCFPFVMAAQLVIERERKREKERDRERKRGRERAGVGERRGKRSMSVASAEVDYMPTLHSTESSVFLLISTRQADRRIALRFKRHP